MGNLSAVVAASIISYLSALLLGLPAYLIFRINGWFKLWPTLAVGALLALLPGSAIVAMGSGGNYSATEFGRALAIFAVHGALVALVFWLIVMWRNGTNK